MSNEVSISINSDSSLYIDKYTIDPTFEITKYGKKKKKCIIPLSGYYKGWKIKTTLINGKMNGETKVIEKNGNVVEKMILKDGKRNGKCSSFDNDGNCTSYGECEDDKWNGMFINLKYDQPQSSILYEMGKPVVKFERSNCRYGYWEERDSNTNELIAIGEYNKEFKRNGWCEVEEDKKNLEMTRESMEGYWSYYVNQCLLYKGMINNNLPNGEGTLYSMDGKSTLSGNWRNGFLKVDSCLWYCFQNQKIITVDNDNRVKYWIDHDIVEKKIIDGCISFLLLFIGILSCLSLVFGSTKVLDVVFTIVGVICIISFISFCIYYPFDYVWYLEDMYYMVSCVAIIAIIIMATFVFLMTTRIYGTANAYENLLWFGYCLVIIFIYGLAEKDSSNNSHHFIVCFNN